MANLVPLNKACAENPLKSSTPLGAALAFLGIEGAVPLFHGSQGCTSFALVLAVRHFKEAIPLQTTAMDEPATVLGGADNLEEALINVVTRMKPRFVGVASTALVETRGEDIGGALSSITRKRAELDGIPVVYASTPDFEGALEDGWSRAVVATLRALVRRTQPGANRRKLVVLPGVHENAATLEEVRRLALDFGLDAVFVPDVSESLDGHIPDQYVGTSLGGVSCDTISDLGDAIAAIALGEHMRPAAALFSELTGIHCVVFSSLLGLTGSDRLVAWLSHVSGKPASPLVRRERSRLIDAMLDAHFHFSGKRIAVAADPDLLCALVEFCVEMGADVVAAVSSTKHSPLWAALPIAEVHVGDLGDLEHLAREHLAEVLITHSHGRMAAEALGIPLFRIGFPIFDQLGHQHRSLGGYVGTRSLVFELANLFQRALHEATIRDFEDVLPSPITEDSRHVAA